MSTQPSNEVSDLLQRLSPNDLTTGELLAMLAILRGAEERKRPCVADLPHMERPVPVLELVEIHNYGDRAIIGAAVTNAWWFAHPEYKWRHSYVELDRVPIVKPDRDAPEAEVCESSSKTPRAILSQNCSK